MTESAPPHRTGFALGLAMAVNQIAIVVMPPVLGLLKDLTGSFVPVWGLLSAVTAAALTISVRARPGNRPLRVADTASAVHREAVRGVAATTVGSRASAAEAAVRPRGTT
ncbi:hypothetical protein [Streptomyces sp. Je 1-332]|uniref:hypothetical protein n=1 Tax=Streptomyces sp. Je 1-332 TaxID=3231270 RepID=UPI00345AD397